MEVSVKLLCLFGVFLLAGIARLGRIDGAGECGQVPVERMTFRMAPCASASNKPQAQLSATCCSQVQKLAQNPSCFPADMLSRTAKSAGVKPDVAMSIAKRCNLVDRPVGYKCGAYTLP